MAVCTATDLPLAWNARTASDGVDPRAAAGRAVRARGFAGGDDRTDVAVLAAVVDQANVVALVQRGRLQRHTERVKRGMHKPPTSSGLPPPNSPRVDLGDALSVCMAIPDAKSERFERSALRWLARFAAEQAQTVADVREAAGAMAVMASDPDGALGGGRLESRRYAPKMGCAPHGDDIGGETALERGP